MSANGLFDHVRRTSRNRIILACLVVGATIAVLAANAPYLRDAWRGPASVTPLMLAAARSPESLPRPWVKVRVASLEDTGIEEITVRKKRGVERGRSRSARYFAAEVGDKLLLVKVRGDEAPARDLVGEVLPMEPGVADALFAGKQGPQLRQLFLPVELDTHDYSENANLIQWVAGLVVAGAVLYAWLAWSRYSRPSSHPALQRAARWGRVEDVARSVAADQAGAAKLGDWKLGERFALRAGTLGFDLHNLDELLWAYAEVIKKKMYYVIPAGQSHAVVLKWRDQVVRVETKEEAVHATLRRIAQNQPWILFGWSQDAEQMYNRQRAALASHVDKARRQHAQDSARDASPQAEGPATQPMPLPS